MNSGINEEFSKIYDKHIQQIYRFAYLKVNCSATAEDIASETFLRYWKSLQNKSKIENCQAFLYKIAKNLVTDYYRKKAKTQTISTNDIVLADNKLNLSENAEKNSDMEYIKAILANMSDEHQDIVIWHYIDDLPISQIAVLSDKSEGAVRTMLSRALSEIRGEVEKRLTA